MGQYMTVCGSSCDWGMLTQGVAGPECTKHICR